MLKFSMFGTALAAVLFAGPAHADDNTVTVGMILPMTGQQASTGKQERAGAELYVQQHGDTVAGKKIVLEVKDDTGAADVTKRLAEEMIGNDHAKVLMGFGLTPLALATAPVATEAKVPEIVSAAATAVITEKSPYIVRTSFTLPQAATPMAEWAVKNGIKGSSRSSLTTDPGLTLRNGSPRRSRKTAERSRKKSACRSRIPTLRPSCSG
jgi:branched-chain amino acid transport system substrate-binding protein